MTHERIKKIATKVYDEMEEKAIVEILFPARSLVLGNVRHLNVRGERTIGSSHGDYTCQFDCDTYLDGELEEVFSPFFEKPYWTVRQEKLNEDDPVIYLEAKLQSQFLLIVLNNLPSDHAHRYLIALVDYKNSNGEQITVMEQEADPVYTAIKGYGENEEIIMFGGKSVAERLIAEASEMIGCLMQ